MIHDAGRKQEETEHLQLFSDLKIKVPVKGDGRTKVEKEGRNDIHASEHSYSVHSRGQELMSQARAK